MHGRPLFRLSFLTAGVLLLAVSLILLACARMIPGFASFYAQHAYPLLKTVIGGLCGLLPISVSEFGLYGLLLASACYIGLHFRQPLRLASRGFFLASALFFLYMINCGVNYYRSPFSYEAGLTTAPSTPQELYRLCEFLVDAANEAAGSLEDASSLAPYPGQTDDTPAPSFSYLREMGRLGQEAMENLGKTYPQLAGWYPYPKPLAVSRILSVQQLCGVYSPFTVEANYNREMPLYNIPHTICHELSHLKGYMREDEANFIGYLACLSSSSPEFRYSGYLMGWVYAGNALAAEDPEGYLQLRSKLLPEVSQDLAYNNQFWDRFEGKAAEVSAQINDSYLKAHRQEDGVKSYGRMVDLMLAYYKTAS